MIFKAGNKVIEIGKRPVIMGILNITPDSFSDGGIYDDKDKAIFRGLQMISEGAGIIDIGGESSRPGSGPVSVREELKRIIPVLKGLRKRTDICISIDTCKTEVAAECLKLGADMINYIKGSDPDPVMFKEVSKKNAGICLMHMRGDPLTMQKDTAYKDIIEEIKGKLSSCIEKAVNFGVDSDSVLIDPGIGFGKDIDGNMCILRNLNEFKTLNKGILIGVSRKSFIGKITGSTAEDRLQGTVAANIIACQNGADIFRVHDVKENRQALDMAFSISGNERVKRTG